MTQTPKLTPRQVLGKYWGYTHFRPLQLQIIESVLAGHDTLGLMPTGGGKSITFQVPALMLDGLTIVVTPLISLMKDQVDNLKAKNIPAATLYSGMTKRERTLASDKARLGKIKLLYLSPERLKSENFRNELRNWNVSLIVVDEAHCISQWGYDFRPSYLKINVLREVFPNTPVLALTASATPVVRKDITDSLGFRPGFNIFALSFHRDNLSYIVRYDREKETRLISALRSVSGCAIVYVRSRNATATYAEALNNAGISATFYHAGLDAKVKDERQQLWKDNKIRVMVATNAFGMGIDKPDVRVVVHMDVPPSLEEYYQEAGRAGRDGAKAYALMIASPADKAALTRRLNAAFPPRDYILDVYEKACVFMDIPVGEGYGHVYEFDAVKFCKTFRLDPDSVRGALTILTNSGYLDYNEDPTSRGRVQILIRRDEFYNLRLQPNEQAVVNYLFRLYPGLFADYVPISEESLAALTSLSQEEVYQSLLALTRMKILHYIPRRLMPYIYIPTARELKRHVVIPRSVYEDRKELMQKRIDAVRQFVFSDLECRDKVLLEYFGEPNATPCGMCDVCVTRRKTLENRSQTPVQVRQKARKLTQHLTEVIRNNPGVDLNDILIAMPGLEEEITHTIRTMLDKKTVRRRGNRLYLVPDK